MAKRPAKPSPSSRALKAALTPALLDKLEGLGVHRTETYRYARSEVTPSADRAAVIEKATVDPETGASAVPANGWEPYEPSADPEAATDPAATGTDGSR